MRNKRFTCGLSTMFIPFLSRYTFLTVLQSYHTFPILSSAYFSSPPTTFTLTTVFAVA